MRAIRFLLVCLVAACGTGGSKGFANSDFDSGAPPPVADAGDLPPPIEDAGLFGDVLADGPPQICEKPPTPAGADAVLAAQYATAYQAFDLGTVPGVTGRLGGCVIKHDDPKTLLIAGDSAAATGAIYAIKVKRGPCGHIIGWDGRG